MNPSLYGILFYFHVKSTSVHLQLDLVLRLERVWIGLIGCVDEVHSTKLSSIPQTP